MVGHSAGCGLFGLANVELKSCVQFSATWCAAACAAQCVCNGGHHASVLMCGGHNSARNMLTRSETVHLQVVPGCCSTTQVDWSLQAMQPAVVVICFSSCQHTELPDTSYMHS
jgi:hypothetical protein